MSDIFKDMQSKVGCDYISDLPSYKRKVLLVLATWGKDSQIIRE